MRELEVLYRDEHYIAVYKPAGMLVHRSELTPERKVVLQRLRDQIGQRVFPVHRLDRPTAGVLIFGLHSEAAQRLNAAFTERQVTKRYLAVVRGYVAEAGQVIHALRDRDEGPDAEYQDAETDYRRLATVELPIPVARYATARYSLVEASPRTGRRHQLRRHFAHISHPIVGDTTHGVGEQNRLFRTHFDCHRLLLLASALGFSHPYGGAYILIQAEPDAEFAQVVERLGWARQVNVTMRDAQVG